MYAQSTTIGVLPVVWGEVQQDRKCAPHRARTQGQAGSIINMPSIGTASLVLHTRVIEHEVLARDEVHPAVCTEHLMAATMLESELFCSRHAPSIH